MKKSRIIEPIVLLLPLLCICLHGWQALQAGKAICTVATETSVPLQQLPLDEERQYDDGLMLRTLTASTCPNHLSKWNGTPGHNLADNGLPMPWDGNGDNTSSHLLLHPDGRSVVIWLHHLII